MRQIYLLLAILGAVVPYVFFTQHFMEVGFGLMDFIEALFVNGAAGGFSADVLISSLVFWCWIYSEKKVPKLWLLVLLNLSVGLSCAFPAYLYLRENTR